MKKKYLFALVLAGLALSSCSGTASVGLDYDESDLEIDTPWVDYSVPVTSVKFAEGEDSITVEKDKTHAYEYEIEPKKALKSTLSWSSADENIATVEKGVVTGVNGGQTTVTVYNEEGSFAPVTLDVNVEVPLEYFIIDPSSFDADFNHSYQLDIEYHPADTTMKGVTWSSSDESLATVDENGLVTTKDVTGTVSISASSNYINNIASISISIADRTIYPSSVEIDASQNELEIGKSFTFVAHAVSSSGQPVTHPEITYLSTNPEILAVEEDTGICHGLKVGEASVYAVASNGIQSAKVAVEVFEVKVASIILDDVVLSNKNGMSDIAVPYSYTTGVDGHPEASIPHFTFETGNQSIATVNDNGKLFAVSVGTTTLTVSEERSGLSKTVALEVKYEVEEVTINGSSSIVIGGSTQLSVSTNPGGVPEEYVTFSSSDDTIATVDENGLVTGVDEGTVVITATVLGETAEHTINVEIPDYPFEIDAQYIVGNRNYISGESKPSETGSWQKANQAFKFVDKSQEAHDTLLYEYYAIITFKAGDIWKIRDASYFFEPDGWRDGVTHKLGEYKVNEGAFAGDDPDMYVDEERNIVVAHAGRYAIYYAQYTNENPEGWYSVYVGRHELTLSNISPKLQIGTKTTLEAHNWLGELTYNKTEGADLISVVRGTGEDNYKFEITAGATAGTAKIVFTDEMKSVTVTVTITETPVSFKAKIHLDTSYFSSWGDVGGFSVYLWDDDGNTPLGDWKSCEGNLNSGVVTVEHDQAIKHFIFYFYQGGVQKQTINLTCNIDDEASDYYMILSGMDWKTDDDGVWKMYNIFILQGQPPVPEEYYYKYYVKGIGGSWEAQEQYLLTQVSGDSNHYTLENVSLTALDEIKVYLDTDDPLYMNEDDRWFGVQASYTSEYATGTSDGNLKVKTTGTYNIDFYFESSYGNHVIISPVGEPEPTTIKTFYFTNSKYWEGTIYAHVWKGDSPLAAWPGTQMTFVEHNDFGQDVYSFTFNTALYDTIIFNNGSAQTSDISLTDFGTNNACYINDSGAVVFYTR